MASLKKEIRFQRANTEKHRGNSCKIKELADQIIAVRLHPIDEDKIENHENADKYLNSEFKEYEQILSELCSSNGIKFIPTFDKLAADEKWDQNLFDGIHLDSEGHRKIYNIVRSPIKAELKFQHSK